MTDPEFDVVCVGAANFDTIVTVDRVPVDDERMTSESMIDAGGGPAATAAVTLARLGARVALCAVIGDDREGEAVRGSLEAEGVDTRWVRTDPDAQTARAIVLASRETGGRSIVTTVAPRPVAEEIPLSASTWLHVDQIGFAPTIAALALGGAGRPARAGTHSDSVTTGGRAPLLSVDAGNPIQNLTLGGCDLYVPTLAALLARYGTRDREHAFRSARAEGAAQVVATAGPEGTYLVIDDDIESIPPFAVEVASTVGAGDVFHGALLAGIVRGEPLARAVLLANAAAALACTRIDGRSGIPTLSELLAFAAARQA